MPRIEPLCSTE